jgi:hypothetical protein
MNEISGIFERGTRAVPNCSKHFFVQRVHLGGALTLGASIYPGLSKSQHP